MPLLQMNVPFGEQFLGSKTTMSKDGYDMGGITR